MDKGILQRYSVWAKENLEQQIEVSLKTLGIKSETDIAKAKRFGDVTIIEGDSNSYPADLYQKRNDIISLIKNRGYKNVVEEFAYTWFNRLIALRFMEVHDFLDHGFRVLSNRAGGVEPEILQNLGYVKDDLNIDLDYCSTLRNQNKVEELYRYVLIQQCNALSSILPMLFSRDMGYLELLLPKTLLRGDTAITKMLEIPEEAFLEDVEIIGWMYQFYISSKKDAVYASKKTITKDTLPAVTQLFTPDWIVRYMAENSVGRIWLESYPSSKLRSEMKYYVEDAEQTEEVQKKLDEIKYKNVNPEDIRIIEPCCGSGHILVYVFDLLFKMYEEKGYQSREIPTLILSKNLYGLDVDKRAAQLASFALIMKARVANNRFFNEKYYVVPNVYEIIDSSHLLQMQYKKHLTELNLLENKEIKQIDNLVELFRYGKTIGSLLIIKDIDFETLDSSISIIEKEAVSNVFNAEFIGDGVQELKQIIVLAKILSCKYDVMITNPPYIGVSNMESHVKEYAIRFYPKSKSDMFSMFMETQLTDNNGFLAMINLPSWMFLAGYVDFRKTLITTKIIVNMLHLGRGVFGSDFGTTAFIIRDVYISGVNGIYKRLFEKQGAVDSLDEKRQRFYNNPIIVYKQESLLKVPGAPITYWLSNHTVDLFNTEKKVSSFGNAKKGLSTGDNEKFIRLWYEVASKDCLLDSYEYRMPFKWIPLNKGGAFRKWYGNNEYVINWFDDGAEIKNYKGSVIRNPNYYFRESITWTMLSASCFGVRYSQQGKVFEGAGPSLFVDKRNIYYLLAALCSKTGDYFIRILNPTINININDVCNVPVILSNEDKVNQLSRENVGLSKTDWDSVETSWDFVEHPLVRWNKCLWDATAIGATMKYYYGYHPKVNSSLELCYVLWQGECKERFDKLKQNEEELNKIFIEIYGLQDELTPEIEDTDVTVRLADKERDIKSLISYLVGIVMGRYSLYRDGLQYAGGEWDVLKYGEPFDDDGIIPIYSSLGMEDSLTTKIIGLIKNIFGKDEYRGNIDFIADALGKKNNESSEETLNRYLNDSFYSDHIKIYQKRPIYWMFSSGKNNGFKCLIYMHRYNADTLARINGKYFLPESTRIKNELDEVTASVATAEGRDRIRLEKERQKLAAKYNEAIEYGQVLDHMANKYIEIALDDGVKANYAKFQDVELVTDGGTKVKKDLLVPIK